MNLSHLLTALDQWGFAVMRMLLAALWQSSLLFAAMAALTWLLRKRRTSIRHALWVAALLAAPLLPLLASAASRAGAPQAQVAILPTYSEPVVEFTAPLETPRPATAPANIVPPTAIMPAELPPEEPRQVSLLEYPWALLVMAYAAGVIVLVAWMAIGRLCIRRWIREGAPSRDERVLSMFSRAREKLGLRQDLLVVEGPRVPTPLTTGIWRPVVLLPSGLSEHLSDEELVAISLHETAHVRRHDTLIFALIPLVRALLFFHPLVWWACRQVSLLAEEAADDAVLEATGEEVSYAKMLTRLAQELPRRALSTELAVGIVLSRNAFLKRIEAILSKRRKQIRRLSRLTLIATVLGAVISLALAAALPLGEKATQVHMSEPQATFDRLTVAFRSTWQWNRTITISSDGSYVYELQENVKDGKSYRTSYRLKPEHLAKLYELLKATQWLTEPGVGKHPYLPGQVEYALTVVRDGEETAVVCHDEKPKEYAELVRFLRRIDRQEWLLFQATAVSLGRLRAARSLDGELCALQTQPQTIMPYAPVLDYQRLVPTFTETVRSPYSRPTDEVVAAVRLLGFVGVESEREKIAKLAEDRDSHVRNAVADALAELGGHESVVVLRGMIEHTPQAAWALIRLGPAAVPAIVEILELPPDPNDMRYLEVIRAYIDHWGELPTPVDPLVIAAVRKNMGARLDGKVEYHEQFLELVSGRPAEKPSHGQPQPFIFHGLNLTGARPTTDLAKLSDLFEWDADTVSYRLRKGVDIVYQDRLKDARGYHGTVYFVRERNIFYVKYGPPPRAKNRNYYGPFQGKPWQQLDIPDPEEAEWGEAVEGVQCRLRAEKLVWEAGELPSFKADFRNEGTRDLRLARLLAPERWEIEIDEVWYRATLKDLPGAQVKPFGAGSEYKDVPVPLHQRHGWRSKQEGQPPQFKPGKRTLRVAFTAHPADKDTGPPVRVVSNPVEIEILPPSSSAELPMAPAAKEGVRDEAVTPLAAMDELRKLVGMFKLPRGQWSLEPEMIAAAEAFYALAPPDRRQAIKALRAEDAGGSIVPCGNWFFSQKQFDEAAFYYELALSGITLSDDVPSANSALYERAKYRLALIQENRNDHEGKPLEAYAEAVGMDGLKWAERQKMLGQIKSSYPESRIIDDVDFALARGLGYMQGMQDLVQHWKKFLSDHPESPLRREAEKRLTFVYHDLGVTSQKAGRKDEAEKYHTLFLQQPLVTGEYKYHFIYISVAEFFEERGDLGLAEQAYRMAVRSSGFPTAWNRLGAFYERHYGLDRYITFLREEGRDVTEHLAELGWSDPADGLQIRLVIPRADGRARSVLLPGTKARLEIRNVSSKPITLALQNTTGGRRMVADDWLVGLCLEIRPGGPPGRRLLRADDEDGYWSIIGNSPSTKRIEPDSIVSVSICLRRLVDSEWGTDLFDLPALAYSGFSRRAAGHVRPLLGPWGGRQGIWRGFVTGKWIPIILGEEPKNPATELTTPEAQVQPRWGEAVEGVQCRLRAEKVVWEAGEVPSFKADFRNQGTRDLRLVLAADWWEIEIDGAWHHPTVFYSGKVQLRALGPGSEQKDVPVPLDERYGWRAKQGNELLQFKPGNHTVRVAFTAEPAGKDAGAPVRVVSNPVEIEILERLMFLGLDLTDAPRTTNVAALPDLWEERPPGSKSYELRDGVVVGRHPEHFILGDVYYLPAKNVFYVQHDPIGSSTRTYYGPFPGKPWKRFGIPEPKEPEWGEVVDDSGHGISFELQQTEGEVSLRRDLAGPCQSYSAWAYFKNWVDFKNVRERFDSFARAYEGSVDRAWLAFVAEEQERNMEHNQSFAVTPELAEEFADFLQEHAKGQRDVAAAVAAFADVLWERATKQFRAFLGKRPNSPFAPEMNVLMAELVQGDPALADDRGAQMRKATVYFKRALEGYGKQFCHPARQARATLANWGGSLHALLEHYEWQMEFIGKGTEADIYQTESVFNFLKGRSMKIPKDRFATQLKFAKENLKGAVSHVTIPTIVRRASPPELDRIIQDYAGTELAEKAGNLEYALKNRTPGELKRLIRDYPDTGLAELAKKRLSRR